MNYRLPTPVLVHLTPPGRGAVATLLIEGPRTDQVADELLFTKSGKKLTNYPADRPYLARFGGENGEEVIVRHRSVDLLELHCHGGYAAVELIEQSFVARGFSAISWKDWLADRSADSFSAAARIALADARTERTAAILLDQYHGALSRAFKEILDTPNSAKSAIELLLDNASLGLHLTKSWRVVLAGEPNVGKSSLLNALVGYNRAIVHHTPGTTRDAVTAQTAFDGWPVELCDTAGLRTLPTTKIDDVEQAGIELAKQQIDQADLLLLVFDASIPWAAADEMLLKQHPQALVVHNKADRSRSLASRPDGCLVSAITGAGIDELTRMIARRLVPRSPSPGTPMPFTEVQVDRLLCLARSLAS